MDNITILDGADLDRFISFLLLSKERGEVYRLRINQREDGMAYKVNEGCWSPTIGRRADADGY